MPVIFFIEARNASVAKAAVADGDMPVTDIVVDPDKIRLRFAAHPIQGRDVFLLIRLIPRAKGRFTRFTVDIRHMPPGTAEHFVHAFRVVADGGKHVDPAGKPRRLRAFDPVLQKGYTYYIIPGLYFVPRLWLTTTFWDVGKTAEKISVCLEKTQKFFENFSCFPYMFMLLF